MKKILVNGAKGRMGQESLNAIESDPELEWVYAADLEDDLNLVLSKYEIDVVLDFTHQINRHSWMRLLTLLNACVL